MIQTREELVELAHLEAESASIVATYVTDADADHTWTEAAFHELRALRLTIAAAAVPATPYDRAPGFEGWAQIELMGHRTRIARVTEVEIAHRSFLELTCPPALLQCTCGHQHAAGDDGEDVGCRVCDCVTFAKADEMVEMYSPAAVFSIAPLSEQEALELIRVRASEFMF